MTIQEIKAKTGQTSLTLVQQLDAQNAPTPWVSHWDNDNRIRVTMHMDVFNKINADKEMNTLALKKEVVAEHLADNNTTKVASYTRYVVITPKNILAIL